MKPVEKIGPQHGVTATVEGLEEMDVKVHGKPTHRSGFLNFLATGLLLVAGHNESRDDHGRIGTLEERVTALERRPKLPFPASS